MITQQQINHNECLISTLKGSTSLTFLQAHIPASGEKRCCLFFSFYFWQNVRSNKFEWWWNDAPWIPQPSLLCKQSWVKSVTHYFLYPGCHDAMIHAFLLVSPEKSVISFNSVDKCEKRRFLFWIILKWTLKRRHQRDNMWQTVGIYSNIIKTYIPI